MAKNGYIQNGHKNIADEAYYKFDRENIQKMDKEMLESDDYPCPSTGGVSYIRIKDYQQRRGETFSSHDFYTGKKGYRLVMKAYLNRDDEENGRWLSLYVVLKKGQNDDKLDFPFNGSIEFTMLSVKSRESNLIRSVPYNPDHPGLERPRETEENVQCGLPQFARHSKVESDEFLSPEGVLIVRVGCKPPSEANGQ